MAGKNERERLLTEAPNNLVQVMANQGDDGEVVACHGLDHLRRNDTPTFKGGYDLKGAKAWLREIKKIFRTFLEKYFPEHVKNMKEMEFLELKYMTVAKYAARFENLVRNANADHRKEKKPMTHNRAKSYYAPPGQYGNHFGGKRMDGFQPTSRGFQLAGGSSQPTNTVS
ncbi:hypothetical protein GmHk_03G007195 [Glycine max]|nr:hypothetical protein GmHk_03G007195 [Glycine max]